MNLIEKLGALLNAHIPLLTALDILSRQSDQVKEKNIVLSLKQSVSEGLTLSEALEKFPREFDVLSIYLIRAGESCASLNKICGHLSVYYHKLSLLKAKLKKALFYPVILLVLTMLISTGLLIFIVPEFEKLFASANTTLPWLTRVILSCSHFIKNNDGLILFGVSVLIIFIFFLKKYLLSFMMILPVLGKIIQRIILSRFFYTLSIVLESGIPLSSGLVITAPILQYKPYELAMLKINEKIIKGERFSHAFETADVFPVWVLPFIAIGESSGQLAEFLYKLSVLCETDADQALNLFTLLIEPAIMLILGVVIGGLIIAMYLPIFELGKVI